MNKIFKIVIQFKKLEQNIQRKLEKKPRRKEQVWSILGCPVHWM